MIKIAVYPVLSELSPKLATKLNTLVETIPYQYNTSNYSNGMSFLKKMIDRGDFIQKFIDYVDDIELILKEVNSSGQLARWRGLDTQVKTPEQEFIAML